VGKARHEGPIKGGAQKRMLTSEKNQVTPKFDAAQRGRHHPERSPSCSGESGKKTSGQLLFEKKSRDWPLRLLGSQKKKKQKGPTQCT